MAVLTILLNTLITYINDTYVAQKLYYALLYHQIVSCILTCNHVTYDPINSHLKLQ